MKNDIRNATRGTPSEIKLVLYTQLGIIGLLMLVIFKISGIFTVIFGAISVYMAFDALVIIINAISQNKTTPSHSKNIFDDRVRDCYTTGISNNTFWVMTWSKVFILLFAGWYFYAVLWLIIGWVHTEVRNTAIEKYVTKTNKGK
jgi:hypothetical protein